MANKYNIKNLNNLDDYEEDSNYKTVVFLVRKDVNLKIEIVEHQDYYPGMCGTSATTEKYGIITLMQKDSYRNSFNTKEKNGEKQFLEDNKNDINIRASIIATLLDKEMRHTILGDCYFIFEEEAPTMKEFEKNLIYY